MTGPEHYREAEGALGQAKALLHELEIGATEARRQQIAQEVPLHLGYAQAHATLAGAAASVVWPAAASGPETFHYESWAEVVGR